MSSLWAGIFTPLVTPLDENEALDLESLARLVDFQVDAGVQGLWAMGTTGEFASFDAEERAEAVAGVVAGAAGRVPVIANISDCSTRLVLRHLKRAESAGADAVAATPPYYFPHSQDELLLHYRSIAAASSLPVFIYNIPQTVRVFLGLETTVTLAQEGTVAGIKDSQNDLEWFRELTLRLGPPDRFAAFAGTRHLIDAAVLAGAAGAIPSIANIRPDLCVAAYRAARDGDYGLAHVSQTAIVNIESRVAVTGGSKNAAIIGALKSGLVERGILRTSKMTAPLLA